MGSVLTLTICTSGIGKGARCAGAPGGEEFDGTNPNIWNMPGVGLWSMIRSIVVQILDSKGRQTVEVNLVDEQGRSVPVVQPCRHVVTLPCARSP